MTCEDILTEIRNLTDTDSTSYTNANILIRLNNAYEEIVGKIIGLSGTWQFDDSNYTSLPIGTQALVASQQDYSFDQDFLSIERVEVKDSAGKYQLLTPIDQSRISEALTEYKNVAGMPDEYDKIGESIFLYPAPATGSVTLAAGLKVYFQRTAQVFTSAELTTGTKVPGFASPYHSILAYKVALPYCMTYKKDRVALYLNEINRLESELLDHYAKREKDVRTRLTMGGISFR